jgi:Mycobacterium membrane protein
MTKGSIVFAVLLLFAGTWGVANASGDLPQVRYEISGPGVAETINYQLDTGQKHAVNVKLPWSTEFTAFSGQVFVLSAQAQGTITCRILVDGNTVSDNTASGTPGRTVCTH